MVEKLLERAFHCFLQDTRLFAGKEFFSPVDDSGKNMVPLYTVRSPDTVE